MTDKINQLKEQVNESKADIKQLKNENDQLHQLVDKYCGSKNANKISDDVKAKKVDINCTECGHCM